MSPRTGLAVAAIGAAFALSGCGGGRESRPSDTPTPKDPSAQHGANAVRVGVRKITFTSPGGGTLSAQVWYPTVGGEMQTFAANAIRPGYQAVADGAVSVVSPAPLLVLIHGSIANADAMAWIALDLVARGAIVVAADHPGSA